MGPFIPWPSGAAHGNVPNTEAGYAGGALTPARKASVSVPPRQR